MFLVISLGGMVYVSFCDYSTSIIIFMCTFIIIIYQIISSLTMSPVKSDLINILFLLR